MKNTAKKSIIISAIAVIVMCVSLMIGGTYAWFTDTAAVKVNKIQAGTLDVTLKMRNNANEDWINAEDQTLNFLRKGVDGKLVDTQATDPVLWEPGATYALPMLQIVNQGNLALQYKVVLSGATGDLDLLDVIEFTAEIVDADGKVAKTVKNAHNAESIVEGNILAGQSFETIKITAKMSADAGNEYQGKSLENIAVTVYAIQYNHEVDMNGSDYDKDVTYPIG